MGADESTEERGDVDSNARSSSHEDIAVPVRANEMPETLPDPKSDPEVDQDSEFHSPSLIGRTLGQYKVLEKIGQGGMGAVFKAHDISLDRTVALKVLHCGTLDNPKTAARFKREAQCLARLSHPNLLHVYNVGQEGDWHYFAMELLAGETLSEMIHRKKRLDLAEALQMAGDVLVALNHIHQEGITHRDVKSSNIIMCEDRAVLMDFGLAKEEHNTGLTSIGAVLGTPEYMAPEQAEGNSHGPQTDLYSFGIVLYEALAGKVPFTGRSAMAIIRKHWDEEPQPLSRSHADVPEELSKIILVCLAKRPDDRFPDSVALAEALLRVGKSKALGDLVASKDKTVVAEGAYQQSSDSGFSGQETVALQSGNATNLAETLVDSPVNNEQRESEQSVGHSLNEEKEDLNRSRPWWFFGLVGFMGMTLVWIVVWLVFFKEGGAGDTEPPKGPLFDVRGTTEKMVILESQVTGGRPSQWMFTIARQGEDGKWASKIVDYTELMKLLGPDQTLDRVIRPK